MPAVQFDAVTKRYDKVVALRDLSMSIEQGEMFGLIGPDGAGKTTTIRLMCGLLKPNGGTVRVHGERWNAVSDEPLPEHTPVRVVDVRGLTLRVTRAEHSGGAT